ncbi:little elongation complex subunit 1 isoform X2 [Ornithorhynchus anatinus]|uniref:little elongation complex subunit 1 isoform X2 n=1 Tax=Ornithorhynchus anatinus TaxID=9258 RepID=UPI0019D48BFD|nr:little elongation complex subunit 1 isoform X2 [Ornithorhynchus anatinus]
MTRVRSLTSLVLARELSGVLRSHENLNEYVAALITLKQKIIDTGNLLAEYQHKCNELQFAERENSTLRHQVEQMLEKISPLEKCQEELGCLKAELEEKKSTLKIYQETHLEYTRVKEECLKSDIVKKKLEARVKKLEEAAIKQTQDFKQLKMEKKILEKELKKAQEKIEAFPKQKNKKVLKHTGTQSSNDDPVANLDKKKIRLLLKELWLCIDSTSETLQPEDEECIPSPSFEELSVTPEKKTKALNEEEKAAEEHRQSRKSLDDCEAPPHQSSPVETLEMQTCLTTLSMEVDREPPGSDSSADDRIGEEDRSIEIAFREDDGTEPGRTEEAQDRWSDFPGEKHKLTEEELQVILNWVKPPPLLSPVKSLPRFTPDTLFGDLSDSSDDEISHSAQAVECILENNPAEFQNTYGLNGVEEESKHWDEGPEPDPGIVSPSKLDKNDVTPGGYDILTTKPRDCSEDKVESEQTASITSTGTDEEPPAVPFEYVTDDKSGTSEKMESQVAETIQEVDHKAVQVEETACAIVCSSPSSECPRQATPVPVPAVEASPSRTDPCSPQRSRERSIQPAEPPGESVSAKEQASQSKLDKQMATEIACPGESVSTAHRRLQEEGREAASEKEEMKMSNRQSEPGFQETSESEDGEAALRRENPGEDFLFSFSTDASSSLNSSGFKSQDNEMTYQSRMERTVKQCVVTDSVTEANLGEIPPVEPNTCEPVPRSQNLSTSDRRSEPSEGSRGESKLELTLRALKLGSGTTESVQNSTEMEGAGIPEDQAKVQPGDQSGCGGRSGERDKIEDQRIEVDETELENPSLSDCLSNLVKCDRSFEIYKSRSVEESEQLLKRNFERPGAEPGGEQEVLKLELRSTLEGTRMSPKLEFLEGEDDPVELKEELLVASHNRRTLSLSLETNSRTDGDQTKSEKQPVAELESLKSCGREVNIPPERTSPQPKGVIEKSDEPLESEEVDAASPVEQATSTWPRSDLKASADFLAVEDSVCATAGESPVPSEGFSVQSQKSHTAEMFVLRDRGKPNQPCDATILTTSGAGVDEDPRPCINGTWEDGRALEEIDPGGSVSSGGEARTVRPDLPSPSTPRIRNGPLQQKCRVSDPADASCFFWGFKTFSSLSKENGRGTNPVSHSFQFPLAYRQAECADVKKAKREPLSHASESKSAREIESESEQPVLVVEPPERRTEVAAKDADVPVVKRERWPSTEIESLTAVLENFTLNAASESSGFPAAGVEYESDPVRNYAAGNSTTESAGEERVTEKRGENELKEEEVIPGEKNGSRLWEDSLEATKETSESEEEVYPLRKVKCKSQFTQCFMGASLQTPTREEAQNIETNFQAPAGRKSGDSSLMTTCSSVAGGEIKGIFLPCAVANPSSSDAVDELPPAVAKLDRKNDPPAVDGVHGETTRSVPAPMENLSRKNGPPVLDGVNGETTQRVEHGRRSAAHGGTSDGENVLSEWTGSTLQPSETLVRDPTGNDTDGSEDTQPQDRVSGRDPEIVNRRVVKNGELDLGIVEPGNQRSVNGEQLESETDRTEARATHAEAPQAQNNICPERLEDDLAPEELVHPLLSRESFSRNGKSAMSKDSCLWNLLPASGLLSVPREHNLTPESQSVEFDSRDDILELETFGDPVCSNGTRSDLPNGKLPVPSTEASTETKPEQGRPPQKLSHSRCKGKLQQGHVTQPVLANADTSTPTKCSSDVITRIREEIGPPLPPLLPPLLDTPPRALRPVSPIMSTSSQSSLPSPLDDLISPLRDTPVPPLMSPLSDDPRYKSPLFASPSPSDALAGRRILTSPLQFCAATPKHALPVPGRLPPSAVGNSTPGRPQENSVKILDTMYPELSARARTLNILKGNIQLNRCPQSNCKSLPGPVNQITGFKAIASTSTAFVKTGSGAGAEGDREKVEDAETQSASSRERGCKRASVSTSVLRSAKRLRLDSESPKAENGLGDAPAGIAEDLPAGSPQIESPGAGRGEPGGEPANSSAGESPSPTQEMAEPRDGGVTDALKKIAETCFDLLPVISSHVYVGNISRKPVMRDQEKEVVSEFGITKKHLAETLLHAILSELKTQKPSPDHSYVHALCRVYVGICRHLGDLERARLFCYTLLKEDFPESEKLTLFIASTWHDIFIFQGVLNKAIQLVARQRARGEVLNCLSAYLNWEENSSLDVGIMISSLLLAIQLCPKMEFQLREKFGEDLSDSTWEYIFAIDLLCCHQKWVWTHDNIVSKELWPVMDTWIRHRKGNTNTTCPPDVIVASILRLIGRLGQLGLKEGYSFAVKNISRVIGTFIKHAPEEAVPWAVQLAAVYALCELSPSNPSEAFDVLNSWRTGAAKSVPSAVSGCIAEISEMRAAERA